MEGGPEFIERIEAQATIETVFDPPFDLVVIQPFDGYAVGDRVTDGAKLKAVYDAGLERNCVRVAREPQP